MYGGGVVLGASAAAGAAAVLPNTGNNTAMAVVATVSLAVGAIVTVTSLARLIAKKSFKA